MTGLQRIIVVTGMPRSGTSWLGQIIESCPCVRFRVSPLFSYELRGTVDEHSSAEEQMNFFQRAYESTDPWMRGEDKRKDGRWPSFRDRCPTPHILAIKQTRFHSMLQWWLDLIPALRVVFIVRDPRAAINSWLQSPEAPKEDEASWRTGGSRKTGWGEYWGFDDWVETTKNAIGLEQRYRDRFLIVHYRGLTYHPQNATDSIFRWLNLPVLEQTRGFVQGGRIYHNTDPYSVYKTHQTNWRRNLSPDIQNEIVNTLRGTELEQFLR